MPAPRPLRFGALFATFHPVGQSPTLALEYDLDRVVELDRLGYDEAAEAPAEETDADETTEGATA